MRVFFNKMGIEKVRFKPAYNPYTEVRGIFSFSLYLSYTGIYDRKNYPAISSNLRLSPHA